MKETITMTFPVWAVWVLVGASILSLISSLLQVYVESLKKKISELRKGDKP